MTPGKDPVIRCSIHYRHATSAKRVALAWYPILPLRWKELGILPEGRVEDGGRTSSLPQYTPSTMRAQAKSRMRRAVAFPTSICWQEWAAGVSKLDGSGSQCDI